mgnify:CR=1 FL=1
MPISILYVYRSFFPYTRDGGPNISSKNIVELLSKRDISVKVLTSKGLPEFELKKNEIDFGKKHFMSQGIEIEYIGSAMKADPRLAYLVLKESKNKITHINGIWASYFFASFLKGLVSDHSFLISPRGMFMKGSLSQGKNSLKKVFVEALKPFMNHFFWHVTSEQEKQELEELKVKSEQIFYIPNPVALETVAEKQPQKKGFLFLRKNRYCCCHFVHFHA